jgi:hypothetical protein
MSEQLKCLPEDPSDSMVLPSQPLRFARLAKVTQPDWGFDCNRNIYQQLICGARCRTLTVWRVRALKPEAEAIKKVLDTPPAEPDPGCGTG